MNKINFKTSDGVIIVADWFPVQKTERGVLLLHMRPATKESWNEFAAKLNEAGIAALAIDLRGHGESIAQNDKKINYEKFPDGSHADCTKDVDGAIKWLKGQGVEDIAIIGGSIGANLAIEAMARYTGIKKGVALSPGLEFLGISTDDKILKLNKKQKILLVASKDDAYSYESAVRLKDLNPIATETKLYDTAGHATKMFDKEPELMDDMIKWLVTSNL